MTWIVSLVLVLVVVAVIAMLMKDGLWSNTLMLINMVTAAFVATNYYEPLAKLIVKQWESAFYLADIAVLWGLFAITLLIMRAITDNICKINVRFPKLLEGIGSPLVAVAIAWHAMCFTAMTLHVTPLQKEPFNKGLKYNEKMLFGLAPDRIWLGMMKSASRGGFSRMKPRVFNADNNFQTKYAERRASMETKDDFWFDK